jgi:uncharacterized membrane protein
MKTTYRVFVPLIAGALAAATVSGTALAQPSPTDPAPRQYRAVSLGKIDGTYVYPTAMNNKREVVGYVPGAQSRAFVWRDGTATLLPSPPDATTTSAGGINDDGLIAGTARTRDGGSTAVYWAPDGSVHTLPGLAGGDGSSSVYDVVGDRIFGDASGPDGWHQVSWQNGAVTDLGRGGFRSYNTKGQSLGVERLTPGTPLAVRREPDGSLTRIGAYAEGWGSLAIDVNVHGVVVGKTGGGQPFRLHAYRWDGKTFTLLPVADGGESDAWAINDAGMILGTASGRNTLWVDGLQIDAASVGIHSRSMHSLNQNGDVLGSTSHFDEAFLYI